MIINYKQIGENIKSARINQKLTQEQLAEMVDVSITHISNIETARTKVGLRTLISISNSLSVTADELLRDNMNHFNMPLYHGFHSLLSDCSDEELSLLIDYLKAGKNLLNKHK